MAVMIRAALVALLALAGCGPEALDDTVPYACGGEEIRTRLVDRSLGELDELAPAIDVVGGTGNSLVIVGLPYSGPAGNRGIQPVKDGGAYDCVQLADTVTASVAGVGSVAGQPSGWICLGPGGAACSLPTLTLNIPGGVHPADATLELTDVDFTQSFPLGDALALRAVARDGGTDLMFSSGQPITLRWSPASDLTRFGAPAIHFSSNAGTATFDVSSDDVTIAGDTFTFTPPPRTGPWRLIATFSGEIAPAITVSEDAYLDVTFGP
jgi:hypothetical protein